MSGPKPTALSKIDEAVLSIRDAQTRLEAIKHKRKHDMGTNVRDLEDIDDKLHDALAALGQ